MFHGKIFKSNCLWLLIGKLVKIEGCIFNELLQRKQMLAFDKRRFKACSIVTLCSNSLWKYTTEFQFTITESKYINHVINKNTFHWFIVNSKRHQLNKMFQLKPLIALHGARK